MRPAARVARPRRGLGAALHSRHHSGKQYIGALSLHSCGMTDGRLRYRAVPPQPKLILMPPSSTAPVPEAAPAARWPPGPCPRAVRRPRVRSAKANEGRGRLRQTWPRRCALPSGRADVQYLTYRRILPAGVPRGGRARQQYHRGRANMTEPGRLACRRQRPGCCCLCHVPGGCCCPSALRPTACACVYPLRVLCTEMARAGADVRWGHTPRGASRSGRVRSGF